MKEIAVIFDNGSSPLRSLFLQEKILENSIAFGYKQEQVKWKIKKLSEIKP